MVNPVYVMATAFPSDPITCPCQITWCLLSVVPEALAFELFGDFLKMHIQSETESWRLGLRTLHFSFSELAHIDVDSQF